MYNPKSEEKWNSYWREKRMFLFDRDDKTCPIYVIDTPPPNPTGGMHMGQAFWVAYVDSIARYRRMKGFNVLYPQGWDAQGFPVELAVEKRYGKDMPREEFYKKCVELANHNINTIKTSMIRLGATFDDTLEYVTMSEDYRSKVQLSILEMFEKGYVYRAVHPVEWCPHCKSSIAREEINEVERDTTFNHIEFMTKGAKSTKPEPITIATTRPELLHACVAVTVNPTDERYKKLIGKRAILPIFGREVEIIGDDSIDMELGTGAEMICTFGDKNDISMYYKHGLELIDAEDESGRLKNAGSFSGLNTLEAREAILKQLDSIGALRKSESIGHTVKMHDRCSTPIELLSRMQWFMKTKEFSDKIKEIASTMTWTPKHTLQRLKDWADYIEWDWNISRSRIFGTPIPFWYCEDCGEIISPSKDALPVNPASDKPPVAACGKCGSSNISGERDVCDCWVDSSITPLVISGWPDDNGLFESGFPNSMRIQGTDIVRTWAFYTIFRTYALTGDKPFENMLVHGIILNEEGKEMHKSEGTGIDPAELIERYSISSVRLWVAASGGLNKDKPFSYGEMEYANGFITKLYNSALFVKNVLDHVKVPKEEPHKHLGIFDLWILNRLNSVLEKVDSAYDSMNLYGASTIMMDFYWHEFCDYYIENVKYRVREDSPIGVENGRAAAFVLKHVLDSMLRALAPIIPHVSEEINSMFSTESIFTNSFPPHEKPASKTDYIINGLIFKSAVVDFDYADAGAMLNIIIGEVRKQKATKRMALNKEVTRINIKVPDSYYRVVSVAKSELENICRSKEVDIEKAEELSVSIEP